MLETLILSIFTLDVSLLVIIINRIVSTPHSSMKQEEDLHDYQEHDRGWEFKILRTGNDGFRNRKLLKLVCEQELRAGWILLEKLDDTRLRFRRLIKYRATDHEAKIDPYRTYYTNWMELSNFISTIFLILIMAVPAFFGFRFMQDVFKSVRTQNLQPVGKPPMSKPPVNP
ncbi:hypothetical protein Syn7502_00140 [Synechococcus sp. PCC 7502]|uniref:hypothetical protein n=1 Tax=Synechococcus sp. PCC 7502 TaxID=1173263 RepID=UPI00029FF5D3|nr:hypothetical protein [Synechococcus sp. PCC 7502]AFY72310.1 hypothetical protein Syn7502_00140 [Synechococcus sp. PCC 7502]